MRLTVGPLPPAVYWRRRALVLGGVLVLVALMSYACGGSDTPARNASGTPGETPSPTSYPTEEVSTEPPSGGGPAGGTGEPSDGPSSGLPGGGVNPGPRLSLADVPRCADSDVALAVKAAPFETSDGDTKIHIELVINNISDRPCKRDTGAEKQEVRVMRGDKRIWSSDDCKDDQGSYLEVLSPGSPVERYQINWDGRTSDPECERDRKLVPEGSYEVLFRLGDVKSEPVTVKWSP